MANGKVTNCSTMEEIADMVKQQLLGRSTLVPVVDLDVEVKDLVIGGETEDDLKASYSSIPTVLNRGMVGLMSYFSSEETTYMTYLNQEAQPMVEKAHLIDYIDWEMTLYNAGAHMMFVE